MNTFRSTFIMDRARTWQEEVKYLAGHLKSRGYEVQGYWFNDNGTVTFGGMINESKADSKESYSVSE